MAIKAGSSVFVYGQEITAVWSPAPIAANAFSSATITSVTPAQAAPMADAVLAVTMKERPVSGASFLLYRRDMNISQDNHATVPSRLFKNTLVGSFPLALVASRQFISLTDIPLTVDQEFYIENASAQTTTDTTVLTITPKTHNAQPPRRFARIWG